MKIVSTPILNTAKNALATKYVAIPITCRQTHDFSMLSTLIHLGKIRLVQAFNIILQLPLANIRYDCAELTSHKKCLTAKK